MSPVNVSAIGSYIREQREQAKISLRQLAQSAGISNPYLSQIERGLRRPSADILQQIAKGLRISAEALYVQAGFLEDRPPGSVVRDAVLTDAELTERQKQMLIEVYESFRKETAMARAEVGELIDDQAGLAPDEAALTWPQNISPAVLRARPRRLAIAPGPGDETGARGGDARGEDARGWHDRDEDDREVAAEAPDNDDDWRRDDQTAEPTTGDDGPGGTVHQFPPPPETR